MNAPSFAAVRAMVQADPPTPEQWATLAPATPTTPAPTGLLDKAGLARALSVSMGTANRLTVSGAIPVVRVGSRVLFDPVDVARYVKRCKQAPPLHKAGRPRKVVAA